MTPDQIIFALIFAFLLGTQVGRVLTLRQQARAMAEGIDCLVRSEWFGTEKTPTPIHIDQDCTPEVGPLVLSITQQCWIAHYRGMR